MGVNLKKILLYQIIFFISAFKLKELIDSNNPKFFYFNFLLLFLHLIFASLSILGNKYYKILTIAFHLLASIANNLPFSKIEKIDFEFFKKHFYEIAIVVNVFILVRKCEMICGFYVLFLALNSVGYDRRFIRMSIMAHF